MRIFTEMSESNNVNKNGKYSFLYDVADQNNLNVTGYDTSLNQLKVTTDRESFNKFVQAAKEITKPVQKPDMPNDYKINEHQKVIDALSEALGAEESIGKLEKYGERFRLFTPYQENAKTIDDLDPYRLNPYYAQFEEIEKNPKLNTYNTLITATVAG
jgi:hypothetical protein